MISTIESIAIANRGEVAVRIINACKELGITTALLHSQADTNSLAYRLCDKPICIGASEVNESYLNIQANIDGALSAGADAIHPGFGFLSENAEFARACKKNKLIFIGPSPESIDLFGNKIEAKKLVLTVDVPLLPGFDGEDQSIGNLKAKASEIGYPIIVKAAFGGGGRGMRIVTKESDLESLLESAKREAKSAFGSGDVFLEKYLDDAKHIEVQVFADASGNVYSLGERECSVQRRHQKVIEESPSANLDSKLAQSLFASAIKICKKAKYKGAGTVEFLVQDGKYYFLEMNTRLQVEHPVTELVYAVDLVKAQIHTASDKALLWQQDELVPRGHSIECRIYAEDPYQAGAPSVGKILAFDFPHAMGRRLETGVSTGDEVTTFYDSMISKIIVWDENRPRAIEKMKKTLKDTVIFGVKTNIDFLLEILSHHEFVEGTMSTAFIGKYFPNGLEKKLNTEEASKLAKIVNSKITEGIDISKNTLGQNPWTETW